MVSSPTDIEKEKQGSVDGMSGGTGGVSASLTPTIWDKTIPYDGETFHLEYMDLDEFLLENGIPVTLEEELSKGQGAESPTAVPQIPEENDENEQELSSVGDETEQEVMESAEGERNLLFSCSIL